MSSDAAAMRRHRQPTRDSEILIFDQEPPLAQKIG
jgi:hypothetical protein